MKWRWNDMLCKEVTRGSKKISPEITDVIKNVITPAAEENTIMRKTLQDTKKTWKEEKNTKRIKVDTNQILTCMEAIASQHTSPTLFFTTKANQINKA